MSYFIVLYYLAIVIIRIWVFKSRCHFETLLISADGVVFQAVGFGWGSLPTVSMCPTLPTQA